VSPKINKQGPSYSEGDPRHVPAQRDGEQVPDGEMNDSSVNGETEERNEGALPSHSDGDEQLPGLEQVQEVVQRPDYGGWTKAQLNDELDRREIEHDPKANNAVLVELLERDDDPDGTITGVND
jgi:hypothetical protein